ncbi:MAG: TadE/TadG family type IV pilus assembly protein [Pseudomonadota bacterium]
MRARLRDDAGLSSVEFALILPAALALILLVGHMSEILMAQARVERAARNLADAAAMMESISDAQMADLRAGTAAVIAPTPGALSVTLTSVGIAEGTAKVRWSDGDAARGAGETLALDSSTLAAYGDIAPANLLVGETQLTYVSRFAAVWNALPFVADTLSLTTPLTGRATALPAVVAGTPPAIVATTRLTAGGAVQ